MVKKTKLKKFIDKNGLKGKWVGLRAGIAETDFSKIVTGKIKPSPEQRKSIAKAVNASESEVF